MISARSTLHRTTTLRAASALLALVMLSVPALAEGDYIQRKNGGFIPTIKGEEPTTEEFESSNYTVLEASLKEISYRIDKVPGTQKYKSVDARDIFLRPSAYPKAWQDAEQALNGGDTLNAARTYRAIGDAKQVHQVIRQQALLRYARAAAAIGLDEGVTAFNYVLDAFPDSFYAKQIFKELASLYIDAGNEGKALETIERMLKLPGITASDRLEADVLKTSVRYGKAAAAGNTGDLRSLLDEYKRIAGQTSGKEELRDAHVVALLGQGNCLLKLDDVAAARAIFEPLTEAKDASDAVMAGAFNGLGECYFSAGDRDGWFEARRCFLRTSILYKDGTPGDELARALFYTGECFARLQDHEDWRKRAVNELGECKRRFPRSAWAKKADSALRGLPKD